LQSLGSAASGIRAAVEKIDVASHRIANVATPGSETNLVREMVSLKEAEVAVKANAAVARVADQTMGYILDVRR